MATAESIKTKLESVSWPAQEKQRLINALPKLGQHSLNFLETKIKPETLSNVVPWIINGVLYSVAWRDLITQGNSEQVIDQFRAAWYSEQYGFGEYIVPGVWDLSAEFGKNRVELPANLKQLFLTLEIQMMESMPKSELIRLFRDDLRPWVNYSNALLDTQRYAYYHEVSFEDATATKDFLHTLAANQEKLGQAPITLDNKRTEPTIKNWITDFLTFSSQIPTASGAFDVVKYLQNSINVQTLSSDERKDLLEILKLYTWLRHPAVTEQEVVFYEKQLLDDYDRQRRDYYGLDEDPAETVVTSPTQSQTESSPAVGPATAPSAPQVWDRANNAKMQDIVGRKAGVIFDNQTNVEPDDLAKEVAAGRAQKQADINQKLQDLRQRRNNKN